MLAALGFCLTWGWLPLLCEKRRQTAEKAGEALPLASICSTLIGHQDSGKTGLEHLTSSSSLTHTNLSRQEDPLKMPQCLKDAETLSTLLPCSRADFHRASATASHLTSGSGLTSPESTVLMDNRLAQHGSSCFPVSSQRQARQCTGSP